MIQMQGERDCFGALNADNNDNDEVFQSISHFYILMNNTPKINKIIGWHY